MGNTKTYAVWAAIAVIVIAAGWFGWHRYNTNNGENTPQQAVESNNEQAQATSTQSGDSGQVLEGTLKTSDNKSRGNLMLVTNDKTIYIFTSRDFSSLLDRQVKVTYDGTLDNFRLGNILAK